MSGAASRMDSAGKEPLSAESRSVLHVVFFTIFLDLVGFSIIFPLFPHMLEHYLFEQGSAGLLGALVVALNRFSEWVGVSGQISITVLFGGALGSVYALLQFVCAPILGSLSDRFGRKPILLVSIAGLAVSYALWFVAGTFTILVLARMVGGMMSGNISTATAVVADVTGAKQRSKGMAIIGIALGAGFICGPVLGGFASELDLSQMWPQLAAYGVNPFSTPAALAFLLAVANWCMVAWRLPETHQQEPGVTAQRPINPVKLFRTESAPNVARANLAYFLFIVAFSGTEFALTFLAAERFGYGPRQIAYMLLFTGVMLVLTQGGYVQAHSYRVGVRRMAIHGLGCVIPGLLLVGHSGHVAWVYAGLLLMAVGAAQVVPCLTTLASLYAPPSEQGRILGVFRSLGALARTVGPLLASILYWRFSAAVAYTLAAAFLVVPLILTRTLPQPASEASAPSDTLDASAAVPAQSSENAP